MTHDKRQGSTLIGLASLAVFSALSACATGTSDGDELDASGGGGSPSDCILGGSVRNYTALDNQNLILYGPGNRPYHVVLVSRAINLETEFTIGVYDRDAAFGGISRICPYGGDAVIVDGPIRERILIRSIERIDDSRVEALKVRYGKTEAADGDAVTVTELDEEPSER